MVRRKHVIFQTNKVIAQRSERAKFGAGRGEVVVERRPVRLSSNLTRLDSPTRPPPKPKPNNGGCFAWAAVVGLVLVIARCSSSTLAPTAPSSAAEVVGDAQEALVSAVSKQTPPHVEPLSLKDVRRGDARVAIAAKEDLAGEMIYSQNCYDVVGRDFSWSKLDECGAFDAAASLALGDEVPPAADKEVAWFDSEAGAGRYLKAATAAGLDSDAADQRLAELQAMVAARRKPKGVAPKATPVFPDAEPDEGPPPESGENVNGAA